MTKTEAWISCRVDQGSRVRQTGEKNHRKKREKNGKLNGAKNLKFL